MLAIKKDITFVTAFYDLSKYESRPVGKNKEDYFKHAELLFKLDKYIIFFVEDVENFDKIMYERNKHNRLNKTIVIIRPLNKLRFMDIYDDINSYLKENTPINKTPKETTLYAIITWNKMYFIEEIIKKNPFETSHFGWIDFGIYHVTKNYMPENIDFCLIPISDKIRILERVAISKKEVDDLRIYGKKIRSDIAAGLWVGGKNILIDFITLFKNYLYYFLSEKLVVQEEGIFALINYRNPTLFDLYYGDYSSLFINYDKIRKYHYMILYNILYCNSNNMSQHALHLCEYVLFNLYNQLPDEQKFTLLDSLFVSSFYANKEKAYNYVLIWIKEMENNRTILTQTNKNKTRILDNMQFLENHEVLITKINALLNKA
jgi:Bacterial protein of unknown function (HtrL_YibB)